MKYLLWIILLALPFFASANIYQISEPDGSTYYTDQPSDSAKPVELDSTGIVQKEPSSSAQVSKKKGKEKDSDEDTKSYTEFKITDPVDKATTQNQPKITVTLGIKPSLFKGDKAAIYLDGKQMAEGEATSFTLDHPDRGQHLLSAKILGPNGETKKESNNVTIFVHYSTVGGGQ